MNNQIANFEVVKPFFLPKNYVVNDGKENRTYNILKFFMKTEQFDNDPFIPSWVKAAVHTAERIGTVAVIGLFLGWLSITLLTRDDERNTKFLGMCQETNVHLQELTIAVHELKVSFDNRK